MPPVKLLQSGLGGLLGKLLLTEWWQVGLVWQQRAGKWSELSSGALTGSRGLISRAFGSGSIGVDEVPMCDAESAFVAQPLAQQRNACIVAPSRHDGEG